MIWTKHFVGRQYRAELFFGITVYVQRHTMVNPPNWMLLIPGEEPIQLNYPADDKGLREALAAAEVILESKINTYFKNWKPSEIEID